LSFLSILAVVFAVQLFALYFSIISQIVLCTFSCAFVEVEHIDSIFFYICATSGNFSFLIFLLKFSKDRMRIIGAHLGALPQPSANKASQTTGSSNRTRPPITTHVLDTALGSPASGIEVHLEMWKAVSSPPSFENKDFNGWTMLGSSITNDDGRSGQLMDIVDNVAPGFYRISFNTSKYAPSGFFPYVSIIFEIKKSQTTEHFHVPLLHSPFSFTTYRGS
jgi:5-hydroxyisourate hydrolase/2-oxo-4-hydroxy-4-carboxy-5-ureidoimidazoline decarboxylase